MVGELKDMAHHTTMEYKNPGDFIVCIGSLNGKLGGSEYLKVVYNKIEGPLANIDMDYELEVQKLCLKAIQLGIINSAHDFSDGGLSVNVAESILKAEKSIGAKISIESRLRDDELLFGECQSVIAVTINPSDIAKLTALNKDRDVHIQTIGKVTDDSKLVINDLIDIDRSKLESSYFNYYPETLEIK